MVKSLISHFILLGSINPTVSILVPQFKCASCPCALENAGEVWEEGGGGEIYVRKKNMKKRRGKNGLMQNDDCSLNLGQMGSKLHMHIDIAYIQSSRYFSAWIRLFQSA